MTSQAKTATTSPPSAATSSSTSHLREVTEKHTHWRDMFAAQVEQYEGKSRQLSLLRLATFVLAFAACVAGYHERSLPLFGAGLAGLLAFVAAVRAQGRLLTAQARALRQKEVHERHLSRIGQAWLQFPHTGEALLPRDHAYAWDIDVVGQGSLFQRIDTTHTRLGEDTLAAWLGAGADIETARARAAAVSELRDRIEWRRELEAAFAGPERPKPGSSHKLDAASLLALQHAPRVVSEKPWLWLLACALPVITLGVFVLGLVGVLPQNAWVLAALAQALLLLQVGPQLKQLIDLVSAKAPHVEGYRAALEQLERTQFTSPYLISLKERMRVANRTPSQQLARLRFWVSLAEVREQALFYVFLDALTLWDVHVAYGLERFVSQMGDGMREWLQAIAELEALCSLATLAEIDPAATMPELADASLPLTAAALVHPLLPARSRVANTVTLRGPGSALVVTGSNMAGKSTLLRAVGQNIALALAGGPVTAQFMRVPSVRLRASMRANDSLEAGSSYFHAELQKLTRVVEHAEDAPPVFFLLDELLRGTNARARHVGAKAVLLHLLARHGSGLCATHDVELAALGQQDPAHIDNVHFTDVVVDGEMRFDYRLRPGIVRTSNALRLLALAGIEVPAAERAALESAEPAPLASLASPHTHEPHS